MLNVNLHLRLFGIIILNTLALAACGTNTGVTVEPTVTLSDEPVSEVVLSPEEPTPAKFEFEIFTGSALTKSPAIDSLIAAYQDLYPEIAVVNVSAEPESDTYEDLMSRLIDGNPPNSFQARAGQSLISNWVNDGYLEDLTSLYEEQGWFDVYPNSLIEMLSTEDGIWSVPLAVYRTNQLWYVPADLENWGVAVPKTWDDFLAICPVLIDQGVTPLTLSSDWAYTHLWESLAVAELGASGWKSLWSGELSWMDPVLMGIWEKFDQVLNCSNQDSANLSWQQAADRVIDGQSAFIVMGSWVNQYFETTRQLLPGQDYAWTHAPGTQGIFIALVDTFNLPHGAPNREEALHWLRLVGSPGGQDIYNPLNGSISPNLESDLNSYSRSARHDAVYWAEESIVPSLAHGAAASPTFLEIFNGAMKGFIRSGSILGTSSILQEACYTTGNCDPDSRPQPTGELEIYAWWEEGEDAPFKALTDLYTQLYPEVTIINKASMEGTVEESQEALLTRLMEGNPPDTFQVQAGQAVTLTRTSDRNLEDLTFLYQQQGWFDKYPPGLIDMLGDDTGIWSIPLDVHRTNLMWYIPDNLETWGVGVPETWKDFVVSCFTLQSKGIIPLALSGGLGYIHLWESVVISELGVDGWNALWEGNKSWTDEDVMMLWWLFGEILACTNENAPFITWEMANDMVINNWAAFTLMGDWGNEYYEDLYKLVPNDQYQWTPSPGTGEIFVATVESFSLPKGAPNPIAALDWLRLVGSARGQDVFNPLNGSISPHFDSDLSLYPLIDQSNAEDWSTSSVIPSFVYGSAANQTFLEGFISAMETVLTTGDVEAISADLQKLCIETGICR